MVAKQLYDGERFCCAGSEFIMLLPRDTTNACEAVLQMVRPGATTPSNVHETFMQIYVVWSGEAEIFIGDESLCIKAPAIAYIPRQTPHWITNLSQEKALHYLYISVWPDGIPHAEIDGGWKRVYENIVDSYASRGYPVETAN